MSQSPSSYDEMFEADGTVRPAYAGYREWLHGQDAASLRRKGIEAEGSALRTSQVGRRSGASIGSHALARSRAVKSQAVNTKERIETDPRSMASLMKVSPSRASEAPAMVSAGM